MRNANAGYTLGCAHRRQLPAALNERSLLVCEVAFPRTKTPGDVFIDVLVVSSVVLFLDVHVDSPPIEVRRANAIHDVFQMPTNANKPGRTFSEESRGRRLDRVSGTLGFTLESRVLRMGCTIFVTAVGRSRMLLRRLLIVGWVFALALRAEPCKRIYATDASPNGAGTQEPRLALYALIEDKGERVRLD